MGRGKLLLQLLKEHEEKKVADEIQEASGKTSRGTQTEGEKKKEKPVAMVRPNSHLGNRGAPAHN